MDGGGAKSRTAIGTGPSPLTRVSGVVSTDPLPLSNGTVVGHWKIGKRLGAGGQGFVWEVRLVDNGRSPPRALKACFLEGEKERARFEREAQLLQQCESDHILPVFESNLEWVEHAKGRGPFAYFVAERCLESLHDAAPKHNATWRLEMFEQACAAVSFLHSLAEPVLHRDLKPQNFLLAEEPSRLLLADFGLARTEASPDLTKTHEVVGTRFYRAPEVLHGAAGDARSDIYSLGRMLEWLLTGQDPDQLRPRPTPRGANLSDAACEALDGVVLRSTATDPTDRFSTVKELREALPKLWLDPRPTPHPDVEVATPESAVAVYDAAVEHARTGDSVGWVQLEASLRKSYSDFVISWRTRTERTVRTEDQLIDAADNLIAAVFPRFAIPLAAAAAGNPAFSDQRRCIDDLLTVDNWNGSGQTIMVHAPRGLVYVFHVLHGAVCLDRGRPRDALRLASGGVSLKHENYPLRPLRRVSDVSGWPDLLGGNCATAWKYVLSLRERHQLIGNLFTLERDYRLALACYSMLLSLAELATRSQEIAKEGEEAGIGFDSPPMFATMETETVVAAAARIFGDREVVNMVLEECGAERNVVDRLWSRWRTSIQAFAKSAMRGSWFRDDPIIPDLA